MSNKRIFWVFWVIAGISISLYFWLAISDPGRIKDPIPGSRIKSENPLHHQQSSLGSVLTAASGLNRGQSPNPNDKTSEISKSLPHIPQIHHCITERLNQNESSSNSVSINLDIIPDDVSLSLDVRQISEESHLASQKSNEASHSAGLSQEPQVPLDEVKVFSENQSQIQSQNDEKYDSLYCTVCFCDQPLRARHCKACGYCVAVFDHHCPYIGNCVGEKNKLLYFWYLIFQSSECWLALWLCYEDMKKINDWDIWCKTNIVFVIIGFVPFLLGILITCLWVYHLMLGFKNWTTYEVLRWSEVYYLKDLNKSPFDLGPIKNFIYYCRPYKKITLWRIL
ncbi:hypothetical protein SteCoe_17957 [Stentor coeruleus]|uniref:Palmitoyltransferase n=1 Tax=Stentor coeruleus TaxID=5963 RepID=A0A1R2BXM8_9CILI|nr:hypothetical protein SteCoe_17957 [Stentor coeruleus]